MTIDFVAILRNLSNSLIPVQHLVTGGGYLLGVVFVIISIRKFQQMADARATSGSKEKAFIPLVYLLGGSALIFMPTALNLAINTAFGTSNVLQYAKYDPFTIYDVLAVIIKTVGILWFIRGAILLIHASEPGVQHGPKGLLFLVAGVLSTNFKATIGALDFLMNHLIGLTQSLQGTVS